MDGESTLERDPCGAGRSLVRPCARYLKRLRDLELFGFIEITRIRSRGAPLKVKITDDGRKAVRKALEGGKEEELV